jgi:ribosomal protein S18 acetylase RimI-like enzyme
MPPSPADARAAAGFRHAPRAEDVHLVERLAAEAQVFNAEEIAVARELVEQSLQSRDGAGYYFLFADSAAGLDGYVCFGPIPGTDRRYELYWIVTATTAQRRGLARALLEAAEADIRARGGVHLFAETSMRGDYAPAHALYEALGYTRFCTVPDYHGDGDGLAIFGKRL